MAKKHILIAAGAASALLLAGCSSGGSGGSPSSAEPSGTITFLTHRTDLVKDGTMAKYVAEFNKLHPQVTVSVEGYTDEKTVVTRLSTGDYGDALDIPSAVTSDQLSEFFAPYGNTSDLASTYRFLASDSYKGIQYGLSGFGSASGIVYNKAVWKAAGVTSLPTTPDQFIADLKLIKSNTTAIPYYTNYKDGWPLGKWQGLEGYTNNLNVRADMVKNSAPWTQGTEQYTTDSLLYNVVHDGLSEPDPTTTSWEGSKTLLATGQIATAVLGSWAIVQFQQAATTAGADPTNIGFMPMPYQVDGKFHSSISGDVNVGVSLHSKNQNAAFAWAKWFVGQSSYAADSGSLSSLVGAPNPDTLKDFTDSGVQFVEVKPFPDPALESKIEAASSIDLFSNIYRQKLVDVARGAASGDMSSYFADLNKAWGAALTSVAG
jgi:raffinose/stachyose/melibiose transport system substrate-binding protein